MSQTKKVLTICPCCQQLAYGNGKSSVFCRNCGFAFIVHDEVEGEPSGTTFNGTPLGEIAKALEELLNGLKKAGFKL